MLAALQSEMHRIQVATFARTTLTDKFFDPAENFTPEPIQKKRNDRSKSRKLKPIKPNVIKIGSN